MACVVNLVKLSIGIGMFCFIVFRQIMNGYMFLRIVNRFVFRDKIKSLYIIAVCKKHF